MNAPRTRQTLLLCVAVACLLPFAASADVADDGEILVPAACTGDASQTVGRVVAKSGQVHAEGADGQRRALACNDVIHPCDTIVTSGGGRVGLLTGDLYAHVDEESRLEIGTEGTLPSLVLQAGAARVIDARADGAEGIPLRTPHLRTTARATDTELWVGGADTRLCNHVADLDVAARDGGDPYRLGSGCAVSSGSAVAASDAAAPSIDVQDAPGCEIEVARFFSPSDVALPGFSSFPDSGAADVFRRDACEASGCPVNATPVPPTVTPQPRPPRRTPTRIIVDPDPDGGCGGPGFGCGEEFRGPQSRPGHER